MGVLRPLICLASHPAPGSVCVISRDVESDPRREWDRAAARVPSRPGRCGAVPCDLGLCASRRNGYKRTRLAETASCTPSRAIDGRGYDEPMTNPAAGA